MSETRGRHSSRVLYKVFEKGITGVNITNRKENRGPYSRAFYHGNKGVLTVDNAQGFVSFKVIGRLEKCRNGYHAFDKKDKRVWLDRYDKMARRVYKVRLYNCLKVGNKWVGTEFEILERVTVEELDPRRWRD